MAEIQTVPAGAPALSGLQSNVEHLHFLGISGHTMRGVALACRERGMTVTGTDEGAYPPGSDWLDQKGFTWWKQPDPKHLQGVTGVIVSGHIQPDHPELVAAQDQGLPISSFAELVGKLTATAKRLVVAGTHGKTTSTSLLSWIMQSAGRTPDYLVGITPRNFETSVRLQGSDLAVLEGDEYRASQLEDKSKFDYYRPDSLILTSLEMDHPDFFTDVSDIAARFRALVTGLPSDGQLLYWHGSEQLRAVAAAAGCRTASYGPEGADWAAMEPLYDPDGIRFILTHHGEEIGEISAPLYGRHNVANVTAAVALALGEGIPLGDIATALESFRGASRRFELVSAPGAPVTVLDDYAHHPTEVATTVEAASLHFPGRVLAIFRPHTYSRTEKLLKNYKAAFKDADQVWIGPIEGAREGSGTPSVSGQDVADMAGDGATYSAERDAIVAGVMASAQPGDTVLCMSVNGFDGLAADLAARLK